MPDDKSLKILGKMYTELNQALWARLELLEHLSNQHDILLQGLMNGISQSDVYKHLGGSINDKPENT